MPHPDKGKIFLKVAARVLLAGMHEVPIVGAVLRVSRECWEALRDAQEQATADERVGQLEQAAALSPDEAQQAAAEVIAEVRAQGQAIDPTRAEAVKNIMAAMPAQIRERTYATLNHARRVGTVASTVLPVTSTFATAEREAFYTSLFPQRMPLFKAGDRLPHGNPEWQLERLLGVGSFGEVWLARRDPVPNQASVYAVKFCQDAASAVILKDEAKNLKKLQGQLPVGTPHIVALLELQLQAMPYWLAFEYIDGGTLESRMRLGPMDWPTAWTIFRPLVEGMAKVHELGVIHRDLKPANILLADGKHPRIADFGIGKVVALQAASMKQATGTHTTRGYGTLGYMSPEQQAGVMEAHPADDVYALGVLLWQMLVGRMKTLDYADDIDDLWVPDTVKAVIRDCVFKPRAKRIQDAQALLQRFNQQPVAAPIFKVNEKCSVPLSSNEELISDISTQPTPTSSNLWKLFQLLYLLTLHLILFLLWLIFIMFALGLVLVISKPDNELIFVPIFFLTGMMGVTGFILYKHYKDNAKNNVLKSSANSTETITNGEPAPTVKLTKKTSTFTKIANVLLIATVLLILMAIVLPAYVDYKVRTKISEGLMIGIGLKAGVSEAFIDDGISGIRRYAAVIREELNKLVTRKITNIVISTTIDTMGFITLKFGGVEELKGADELVFSPHINGALLSDVNSTGTIEWVCAGEIGSKAHENFSNAGIGTIINNYLPRECR